MRSRISLLAKIIALFWIIFFSNSAYACKFTWRHYGNHQVLEIIRETIGDKITDEYCQKYNSKYLIFIHTVEYANSQETAVQATVGLVKRGSNDFPSKNRNNYYRETGNFVVGYGYKLSANNALNAIMDLMSDLENYAN